MFGFFLVAVSFSLLPTTVVTQLDTSPTPTPTGTPDCVAWVDGCTGEHHCTDNSSVVTPSPSCFPPIPTDLTPAPGVCTLVNGSSCQFVNPCIIWNKECFGTDYQCTDKEHYIPKNCTYFLPPPPPPKEECLPINGTCQQYNLCRKLPGLSCGEPWQCLTEIQYYKDIIRSDLKDSQSECPSSLPPGECIYQNEQCVWSNCTAWFDVCTSPTWSCTTHWDLESYRSIHSCPYPGPASYQPQPGPCNYNVSSQQCNFLTNVTHPCETAVCPPSSICKVYDLTNAAYCQASCDSNNGGCSGKCVLRNYSEAAQCLPSCFVNNGGCQAEQICTSITVPECSTISGQFCDSIIQCSNDYNSSTKCVPGMKFSTCATLCEPTCETYDKIIPCPDECVLGCECPAGLVQYRDRCVSPLECSSLLNNPPPIDPLPQPSDTVLIGFTLSSQTVSEFMREVNSFITKLKQLLVSSEIGDVHVKLYAAIQDGDSSSSSSSPSTQITVVMVISSSTIEQGMTGDEVVALIREKIATLDVPVAALYTVVSKYGNSDVSVLSPAEIVGILIAVVAFITLILIVTAAVVILIRRRRNGGVIVIRVDPHRGNYAKIRDYPNKQNLLENMYC